MAVDVEAPDQRADDDRDSGQPTGVVETVINLPPPRGSYDLLDLSPEQIAQGVIIELHVWRQDEPGGSVIDTMTPFYLAPAVSAFLLNALSDKLERWILSFHETFGMAWSGITWAIAKLIPMISHKVIANGGAPIPPMPRGEDSAVHLMRYLVSELPKQSGGMVVKLIGDEYGHVIGGGVEDLREEKVEANE